MKLLLAIVWSDYAGDVTVALNEEGFGVTRISSTGGFWRRGNTTLMIGVDDDKVDRVAEIISANAGPAVEPAAAPAGPSKERVPHRATIFVLGVNTFAHY
jgi:uncharacterized protein YaaQ